MTPHAFPMFTKPTYQENYHDVAVPLNDFDMVPSPPCLADDAELSSPDLDRNFDPPPHMQYSVPSPMTSSPLFISDVHVTSPHLPELSPAQSAFLFSSDDATLPTPPHTSSYFPEQDEIHNVLHNQYSFISSVYAISPTPGSLPLEALIGNSSASSRAQASSPLLGPTWSNSPRISAHTSTLIQPRSGSADVYKARLLAYATAAADQLSSTGGDEVSTYQRWGGEQLAVDDTHEHLDNFETYNEMVPKALNGDTLQDLSLEDTSKGPSQSQDLEFSPVNQLSNEPHTLAPIAEVSSETNEEDLPNSKNLNQIDTELFEDWQDEPEEDDFDDRTLDPEHDFTLAEQDELAADEEAGKVPISLPQGSAPFIQDKQEPIAIANQKRNLPIPPFPVSSSRQAESEHKDPSTSSEVMTKLSPKFAVRSARCVRPSPFAHLLKKRREPAPNVEGTEGQDPEDEIEVWPA
ncbi:hypothetical protein FRC12_004645 [Ceratobasidium sp. 428]|nr:hypothetical protein FRC12_004645 [Ceratobasidium sp. 428]